MTTGPKIPQAIAVGETQRLILKAHATGVQIYLCTPKKNHTDAYEWTFQAPEASLFNDEKQAVGKHYAGPTWEAADGSKVIGKMKARADAPEWSAIPWLLLEAKSTEGAGLFSQVKLIQRVETKGGMAPAKCEPSQAGTEVRVDYQADYYFYGE